MGTLTESVDSILRKADDFFMGQSPVHKTMRSLARRLPEEDIDYAVLGGMALLLHGYNRETIDVDILVSREGLDAFKAKLVGRGYVARFPGANKRFRDTETGVDIDIIAAGEYPGNGQPKPVVFPEPHEVAETIDGIRVVNIVSLIELKLVSGLDDPINRLRDLADVQQLIARLALPRELGDSINPSVRPEYFRLWDGTDKTESE